MVGNIIYYFSGTGNSLDVAKHIAEQLGDTRLISMSANPMEIHRKSTNRVGFVYPVYYGGMPFIVERFIRRIHMTDNIYVFAVATGAHSAGNAIKQMNHLFNSMDYHLSYSAFIRSVDNNLLGEYQKQNIAKRIANSYVQLKEVIEAIRDMVVNQVGSMNPFTRIYHQIKLGRAIRWEQQFEISEACKHCGICAKVCPVGNIELVDGKPLFHHHCEACMACIQLCPMNAINYKKCTIKKERYHHPNVEVEELIQSNRYY